MKLVIDIQDEMYNKIRRDEDLYIADVNVAIFAIKTGTLLPKGHGRLIDADAVLEDPIGNTYKDIDIAETIIEADKEDDAE